MAHSRRALRGLRRQIPRLESQGADWTQRVRRRPRSFATEPLATSELQAPRLGQGLVGRGPAPHARGHGRATLSRLSGPSVSPESAPGPAARRPGWPRRGPARRRGPVTAAAASSVRAPCCRRQQPPCAHSLLSGTRQHDHNRGTSVATGSWPPKGLRGSSRGATYQLLPKWAGEQRRRLAQSSAPGQGRASDLEQRHWHSVQKSRRRPL
jgi:hypothetical protein